MRKVLLFAFILCSLYLNAQTEHLRFMGIEINGTIASFQEKLLSKGVSVSPMTKNYPNGMRAYSGTFSGEKADIVVWYNPRSKQVYRAKAMITRYGKDRIEQLMGDMERKLNLKYGTTDKYSETIKDDHLHEFEQHSYTIDNGTIDLFITSSSYSSHADFVLHVDYKDKTNYVLNTMDEMDDL